MTLDISGGKSICDLQQDFNKRYPYLKLEFYPASKSDSIPGKEKQLNSSTLLKKAGLVKDGKLFIDDSMTVRELEKKLLTEFGLAAQVSRRSGIIWLQTTITDNWTLRKQNEHGRELSHPASIYPGNDMDEIN